MSVLLNKRCLYAAFITALLMTLFFGYAALSHNSQGEYCDYGATVSNWSSNGGSCGIIWKEFFPFLALNFGMLSALFYVTSCMANGLLLLSQRGIHMLCGVIYGVPPDNGSSSKFRTVLQYVLFIAVNIGAFYLLLLLLVRSD